MTIVTAVPAAQPISTRTADWSALIADLDALIAHCDAGIARCDALLAENDDVDDERILAEVGAWDLEWQIAQEVDAAQGEYSDWKWA